jgi:hypothetical protein
VTCRLQCHGCRHFEWGWIEDDRCNAYPDGIPDAIWVGEADHSKPFSGDGGVRREAALAGTVNPRDVRHHAFWVHAMEPLPHERDPLGQIVLEMEKNPVPGPDPDTLRVAWGSTEDAYAMLHVLFRSARFAQIAQAIQLASAQLEAEGCDFVDDQGWLTVTLTLSSFHDAKALANIQTAWKALTAPLGHQYLASRTQLVLLRSMRRVVPDPPAVIEWTDAVGPLSMAESLRIVPQKKMRPEELKLLTPWTTVTNAAGVEAELAREVGPEHRLHGRSLRALGRRSDGEEVLFADETLAAVVRLTWAKEVKLPEPLTDIYPSLDEWVARRMQPDHHDFTGAEPRMFAFKFKSTLDLGTMLTKLGEASKWDWVMDDSQWYGSYLWAKKGSTRIRIFAEAEEEGSFTVQAELADRADEGQGWFAMTRAVVTKSVLPTVDATESAPCTPSYD